MEKRHGGLPLAVLVQIRSIALLPPSTTALGRGTGTPVQGGGPSGDLFGVSAT